MMDNAFVRIIINNLRKIITATFGFAVIFLILFLDNSVTHALFRIIYNNMELLDIKILDKILTMVVMYSGLLVEAVSALSFSSIILKLVSLLLVSAPLYMLLLDSIAEEDDSTVANKNTRPNFSTAKTINLQDTYFRQSKFIC